MKIILQTNNLNKRYGRITAVSNLSFTIHEGNVFGILGPNGSGKTTTLSIITDVIRPDEGDFFWDGLSRIHLLTGKASVIVMIAIYSTLMVFLFSVVFGFIFTRDYTFSIFYEKTYVLLVYFLQAIAYMALGFFIAVLFKNTGLSITLFILFRFVIEPVIRLFSRSISGYIFLSRLYPT